MKKRFLLIGLAIIVGGFFLFGGDSLGPPISAPIGSLENEEPDYYGIDLERRIYGADGRLQQTFAAATSEHYPEAQFTRFEAPYLISSDSQGKAWSITSKTGEVLDKEQMLSMITDVEIKPFNPGPDEDWLIETSLLHYYIKRQFAQTDKPVEITNPTTRIDAVGLRFYVQDQHLELLQQVKTHHVPPVTE